MSIVTAHEGVNRVPKSWYASAGGVNRKLKSLWARDNSGVNRKIYSGSDFTAHFIHDTSTSSVSFTGKVVNDNDMSLGIGIGSRITNLSALQVVCDITLSEICAYSPSIPIIASDAGLFYAYTSFIGPKLLVVDGSGNKIYNSSMIWDGAGNMKAYKIYPTLSGQTDKITITMSGQAGYDVYPYDMILRTGTSWRLFGKSINSIETI